MLVTLEVRAGYLCVFDPLVGELAAADAVALYLHQQGAIVVEPLEEADAVGGNVIGTGYLVVRLLGVGRDAAFNLLAHPYA